MCENLFCLSFIYLFRLIWWIRRQKWGTEEVLWLGQEAEVVSSSVLYCIVGDNCVKRLENLPLNSKYFMPLSILYSVFCFGLFLWKLIVTTEMWHSELVLGSSWIVVHQSLWDGSAGDVPTAKSNYLNSIPGTHMMEKKKKRTDSWKLFYDHTSLWHMHIQTNTNATNKTKI